MLSCSQGTLVILMQLYHREPSICSFLVQVTFSLLMLSDHSQVLWWSMAASGGPWQPPPAGAISPRAVLLPVPDGCGAPPPPWLLSPSIRTS